MKFFENKENIVITGLICMVIGYMLRNMYNRQIVERDIIINEQIENINAESQSVLIPGAPSMNAQKAPSAGGAQKAPSTGVVQKAPSTAGAQKAPSTWGGANNQSAILGGDGAVETNQEAADDLRETLSELKVICDTCSKDTNICSPECQEMREYCEYLGYENAPFVPCTASDKHFSKIESPVGFNFEEQIEGVIYQSDVRPQKKNEITGPVM